MSHIESGGEWYEDGSDIILQGTNTTLINGILTVTTLHLHIFIFFGKDAM